MSIAAKPPKKMGKKERKKWQKQQRAAAAKARKAKEDAEFAAQLAAAKGEDAVSEEEGEEEPAEKDADAGAEVDAKPPKKENIPTHTDAADCSAPIDPAAVMPCDSPFVFPSYRFCRIHSSTAFVAPPRPPMMPRRQPRTLKMRSRVRKTRRQPCT